MHSSEAPTVALRRLVNGYQVTQAIHVAATLGIADLLRDGPRDSDALAQETATHAPSLHRVLRALASVGVLHEGDDGRFALTAIGDCLRSDAAEPVGAWAASSAGPTTGRRGARSCTACGRGRARSARSTARTPGATGPRTPRRARSSTRR